MKNLFIIFIVFLFISCKNKYPEILQNRISNLKQLSDKELIESKTISWNAENEPEYFLHSGQKMTRQNFSKKLQTNSFKQLFFVNKMKKIEVVILEPLSINDLKLTKRANKKILEQGFLMPNWSAKDINGKIISLKKLKGKVVVLNFWFIDCPPCRKEIPQLNKLVNEFSNKNVAFISLSPDEEADIKRFLAKESFEYQHISNQNLIKKFNIFSYPENVVINKNGIITYSETGGREDIFTQLKVAIEKASR